MKNLKLSFILIFFGSLIAFSQETSFSEEEIAIDKFTDGTLTRPTDFENPPLVIFIQGSGPTNRDGNSPEGMSNTSDFAKKIAFRLAEKNIASFRFDKRSLKAQELNLEAISFDDLVIDVEHILDYFEKKNQFSKYIIAGHSQGSLVGMIAARDNADAFISLAGPGKSIDYLLTQQLSENLPQLKDEIAKSLQEIKKNGSSTDYPKIFENIFHPNNQAFLASWMKYEPTKEIAKLEIPVLIIQGKKDIQVNTENAEELHQAAKNSKLVIIEEMNHVFRKITSNEISEQYQSYSNPDKPLHPEIIPVLTDFIKNLENK